MKLPYVQDSPDGLSPEDAAIYDRIKQRRGGSLLPLDKALFHSPKLADGKFILHTSYPTGLHHHHHHHHDLYLTLFFDSSRLELPPRRRPHPRPPPHRHSRNHHMPRRPAQQGLVRMAPPRAHSTIVAWIHARDDESSRIRGPRHHHHRQPRLDFGFEFELELGTKSQTARRTTIRRQHDQTHRRPLSRIRSTQDIGVQRPRNRRDDNHMRRL